MKSVAWLMVFVALANLDSASALAGNVQASIQGGSLYIYGDDNASSIVVDSPLPNRIRIRGRNIEGQTTTVNSRTTPVVLGDWTGGVFIYLYDGTDAVRLLNARVNGPVHIDLGNGNDDAILGESLEDSVATLLSSNAASPSSQLKLESSLFILGGAGNDYVQIDNASIEGRTTLNLGDGIDDAYVTDVNVGDTLAVFPGFGSDLVDIFETNLALDLIIDDPAGALEADMINVNVGRNAFIYATSAADFVRGINLHVETLFQVFTEGANDIVALNGQSRTLEIFAGSGNDRVRLSLMTADTIRTFLDSGVDSLVIEDSDVSLLNAYGGADSDVFTVRGSMIQTANIYGDGGTDRFRRNATNIQDLNLFSIENP